MKYKLAIGLTAFTMSGPASAEKNDNEFAGVDKKNMPLDWLTL